MHRKLSFKFTRSSVPSQSKNKSASHLFVGHSPTEHKSKGESLSARRRRSPTLGPTGRSSSSPTVTSEIQERQRCSSTGAPAGFLNVGENESKNPRDQLLFDYNLLHHFFPDFPGPMLKVLLAREKGNGAQVLKLLSGLGWGTGDTSGPLLTLNSSSDLLSSDENSHFTTPYFWGEYNDDFLSYLDQNPGAYFTVVEKPNIYALFYANKKLEVRRRDIDSPVVIPMLSNLYGLKTALPRPTDMPLDNLLGLFE